VTRATRGSTRPPQSYGSPTSRATNGGCGRCRRGRRAARAFNLVHDWILKHQVMRFSYDMTTATGSQLTL
jgi:hypothetical protein